MDQWSFQGTLLRVAAIILLLLAIFDLAKIGFCALIASLVGEVASLLPRPLEPILRFFTTLSGVLLALAAITAVTAVVAAILLLRLAGRVDSGTATAAELDAWLVVLIVLAALSALTHKWFYSAAYAAAIIGAIMARAGGAW